MAAVKIFPVGVYDYGCPDRKLRVSRYVVRFWKPGPDGDLEFPTLQAAIHFCERRQYTYNYLNNAEETYSESWRHRFSCRNSDKSRARLLGILG